MYVKEYVFVHVCKGSRFDTRKSSFITEVVFIITEAVFITEVVFITKVVFITAVLIGWNF